MNGLDFLFDSSVWQQQAIRLSLTLLHFLWQGLLVGVVAAIALACFKRKSANARYLIACVAFFSVCHCWLRRRFGWSKYLLKWPLLHPVRLKAARQPLRSL